MSESALEEVSVLSAIYCGEGEFQLVRQSESEGLVVQINTTAGEDRRLDISVLFQLHPDYPSSPPDVSVSSTGLSRNQCCSIRQKLLEQAAALTPQPMVHQLMECLQQCVQTRVGDKDGDNEVKVKEKDDWTAVFLLDHIRSQNHYIKHLKRWSQQLQLTGTLFLGRNILIILQGDRHNIKDFVLNLKTSKVDVDSSGKKCKERMMKVLIETPSVSSRGHGFQSFEVKNYRSLQELATAFQEINMTELYQQIRPSLSD